jgi:hydrogenase-4 component E
MLVTAVVILVAKRLDHAIYTGAVQSILLALAGGILADATGVRHLWVIAGITFVLKGVVLPRLLTFIIRRLKVPQEIEPILWVPAPLAIATVVVLLAFYVTEPLSGLKQAVTGDALPYGISLTLLGVLVMIARKKAITQMVGLYTCENGIFFTGMAVSHGMPLFVEIGVVLDVALGMLVMAILLFRVSSTIDAVDIDDLHHLRG